MHAITHKRTGIKSLPSNDDLPPQAHQLADTWRKLEDRIEDLEDRFEDQQDAIREAARADAEALKAAVLADEPVPEHEREPTEQAVLDELKQQAPILVTERQRVSTQLRSVLTEHRAWIAEKGRERLTPALADYRAALADAARTVKTAAQRLRDASELLGLADDLYKGHDDPGIHPAVTTTEGNMLGFGAAQIEANKIAEWLANWETPAARYRQVRGKNGITMRIGADTAVGFVRDGQGEYLDDLRGPYDPPEPADPA
ncbi:hypothetical protein [Amycolatopsis aidingensis]|uniref:hypothetical protein n=1 Tax=Amycolatopsis aidingensis TaxID=2842453 RepID=UPI001C0D3D00|nr:hypothetical protein [Amycolatopsis aidingensis]